MEHENSPDLTPDDLKSVIKVSDLDNLWLELSSYFDSHGNPDKTTHEFRVFDERPYWRVRMKYSDQEKTLLFTADWLELD